MTLHRGNDSVLADFVRDMWLPHIRAYKASWKLEENIAKNHILPALGAKSLAAISEEDVRHWLDDFQKQRCAPATCNRRLHVLKSIFSLAVETGSVVAAPTVQLHTARVKKSRWPTLDEQHLANLWGTLSRSPKKEARAISLLLLTGARKREILNARWENLFLDKGLLLASRARDGSQRKIWLSADAKEILRSIPRQEGSPWIFPGRDISRPISDIFLFWKELRSELELGGLSIRDLRYVFAERQLRSGISPVTVQSYLGINDMRWVNKHLLHTHAGEVHVRQKPHPKDAFAMQEFFKPGRVRA